MHRDQSKPHTCKSVIWQLAKFVSSAKKEKQLFLSILLKLKLTASWDLTLLHTCNFTSAPTAQLWQQSGQSLLFQVQKDVCISPQAKVRVLREAVVIHGCQGAWITTWLQPVRPAASCSQDKAFCEAFTSTSSFLSEESFLVFLASPAQLRFYVEE